ncbi:hypothetical protein [Alteromonas sp. A079]|uniref:hypothetical protein n=1 Tax=Alteromonas sp. A079 TaxID=3410268 RepID=UPI003B9EA70F
MDILANVTFLKIKNQDWNAVYKTGMRSNISYGKENFCCLLAFNVDRAIGQGETVECEISFLTHEPHTGKLYEGMPFKLFVGSLVFAEGSISYVPE